MLDTVSRSGGALAAPTRNQRSRRATARRDCGRGTGRTVRRQRAPSIDRFWDTPDQTRRRSGDNCPNSSAEHARQTSSSCGCSETGHPDRRGFPDPQTGDAGACTTAASPHRHPGVSMRRYLSCRRCRPLPRQACAAGPGRVLWRSCLDCQIRITGPPRPGRARGSGRRAPLNRGLAGRAGWRACR